jgi:ribonucleoside-diphosphate reductase alpha chain
MHIDNSACNLSSLNLLKFLDDNDRFDVEAYRHAIEVMFTAQEILVGRADYPTEMIGENSRKFRQLGLGYANLGALLMALGMAYDSDGGRALVMRMQQAPVRQAVWDRSLALLRTKNTC